MDAESIKLIADTLNTLSGDAKTMFIWWLVVRHLLQYVIMAAVLACAYSVAKRIITNVAVSYRVLDALGWHYWDEERRTQVYQFLRAHRKDIE